MMPSKYKGRCRCGATFQPGASIEWSSGKVQSCPECREDDDSLSNVSANGHNDSVIASAQEIQVEVRRIMWAAPDHSHVIAHVTFDSDAETPTPTDVPVDPTAKFSIIGPLGPLALNDVVRISGKWEPNVKFGGMQFRAIGPAALAVSATAAGMKRFLVRFVPHCGPKTAEKIILEAGGASGVFNMIRDTPLGLCTVAGITEERALDMQAKLIDAGGFADLQLFAAEIGMTNHMIAQCIDLWGLESRSHIEENPYILMDLDRVGFVVADKIATSMKIATHDARRCAAAAHYLLEQSTYQNGHTWTTYEYLAKDVADDLKSTGLTMEQVATGVGILCRERVKTLRNGKTVTVPPGVTVVGDRLYLASIEYAERMIASKLNDMLGPTPTRTVAKDKPMLPNATVLSSSDIDDISALM